MRPNLERTASDLGSRAYQTHINEVEMRGRGNSSHFNNSASYMHKSDINSEYQIDSLRVPQSDLEQIHLFFQESDEKGFIRRVYGILAVETMVMFIFVLFTLQSPEFLAF